MKIDIVYLAWNRREFTEHTWAWLLAHTDWVLVDNLIVYDDGSEDGTQEFLADAIEHAPVDHDFRVGDFRSPPAVMNHYLATSTADLFAKIDSDIAVPGGWLPRMRNVYRNTPGLELLGMEAGMTRCPGRDGTPENRHRFQESSHIGGVGLMRVDAFRSRPRLPERGRFGFTEWQERYDPVRGWIDPDLFVPQLDRLPFEPFRSLAETYVENGWSRPWPVYDEWCSPYYEWVEASVQEQEAAAEA